ncbi:Metallo-hydrolase/oxidoreductase [Aspergillus varians]
MVDRPHQVITGIESEQRLYHDVALGDWLEETLNGRSLTTIDITHGHGDHWFNLKYLVQRFPGVNVVAAQSSIDHMATQLTPDFKTFWSDRFPDQITEESYEILAKPLKDNKFTLQGQTIEAIHVGHSDTDETTFVHVPDLRLVVAGDTVYNDVHMWMAESPKQSQRDAWLQSLAGLQSDDPAVVIASHHRPRAVDGAWNIAASIDYIKTFGRLAQESTSARELFDKVLHAYPNRIGKLVLWLGCQAVIPDTTIRT